MPLYEYQCRSCGKTLEVLQKFSDEPLTVHENCGGTLEKLISRSAIQFKGSGWYVTDYAKGGSADSSASGDAKNETGKPSDGKNSEGRASEGKASDGKTSEGKASDTSSSPAKSSESKPSGSSKSSESAPSSAPASTGSTPK